MSAEVDHEAVTNYLTGERSARGARNQRETMMRGEQDKPAHIRLSPRQRYGQRHLLILGSVRGEESAHRVVAMQITRELGRELVESSGEMHGLFDLLHVLNRPLGDR